MSHLDFAAVLAIGIHDMKNSVNRVVGALDGIIDTSTGDCRCDADLVAQLQYEARRINDNLLQILTLYRTDKGLYQPHFAPIPIAELLEDCWLGNKPLLDYRDLGCECDCDDRLSWIMDRELIESVLDNVLTNSIRYTQKRIRLSARHLVDSDSLELCVDDDGPGYPDAMLGRRALSGCGELDRRAGRTGLGLYFCALVAACHAQDGRVGFIELTNISALGGGLFRLVLPRLTANSSS